MILRANAAGRNALRRIERAATIDGDFVVRGEFEAVAQLLDRRLLEWSAPVSAGIGVK